MVEVLLFSEAGGDLFEFSKMHFYQRSDGVSTIPDPGLRKATEDMSHRQAIELMGGGRDEFFRTEPGYTDAFGERPDRWAEEIDTDQGFVSAKNLPKGLVQERAQMAALAIAETAMTFGATPSGSIADSRQNSVVSSEDNDEDLGFGDLDDEDWEDD